MKLVFLLVVMIAITVIAYKKGFSPLLWFAAAGAALPAFIAILCLPQATEAGIDEDAKEKRRKKGNKVGAVMAVISVVLVLGLALVKLAFTE